MAFLTGRRGSVILELYERRPTGRARHLRVSLARWLAGRGNYLLESHASKRAQAPAHDRFCRRVSRAARRPASCRLRARLSARTVAAAAG